MTDAVAMRGRTTPTARVPVRRIGPESGRETWHERVLAANAPVIAIDTSTRTGGVALCRGVVPLAEETWLAGGRQTAQMLPAIERLLERAGYTPRDLRLVVVATGPGSFTGLRVGASLGKGLAVALTIPLVGVPALDVVAYQQGAAATRICAVVDAGRGQLYYGTYRRRKLLLEQVGDFGTRTIEELAAELAHAPRGTLVCGELDGSSAELLAGELGDRVQMGTPAAGLRRAVYLAELGRWELAARGADDPAALQPIYLRRSA